MGVDNIEDFHALEPFFRVIENGLAGLAGGGHFFDHLADDVVFEFIITVPDYPRRIAGRDNMIELYRGHHKAFFLDRCFDLKSHRADDSTVTLEYASEGKAIVSGRPYSNHYISVVTIKDRKITHWRDYLDPLRVFAALGVSDQRAPLTRPDLQYGSMDEARLHRRRRRPRARCINRSRLPVSPAWG